MATITEDYVSFETAKLLKEKGFDGFCERFYDFYPETVEVHICGCDEHNNSIYDDEYSMPTLQMAMKWLREIHGYVIVVEPGLSEDKYVWTYKVIFYRKRTILLQHKDNIGSSTYEETCEAAIKYCLEYLI